MARVDVLSLGLDSPAVLLPYRRLMRRTEEISATLRRWPRNVLPDNRTLAKECTEQCRELFEASRVLLLFEQGDEPWATVASLDDDGFKWREEEVVDVATSVAEELSQLTFFAEQPLVRVACVKPVIRVETPVHAGLGLSLPLISAPVVSENVNGRLFVQSPSPPDATELCLAEAIGILIATRFEATLHVQNAVHEAVAQDRIRVARDLHDGLLQSFTGVVLQLETIHSMLESQPAEARKIITETQATIMADQRELRRFVEQLRPRPSRREPAFDFPARIEELRSRFASQWSMNIEVDVERIDPLVSAFLGQETFRLIHEAVTNSAKHGAATRVRVGVRTAGSEMLIEVTDNGSGFPFRGRMTLDQMREGGAGPMVLAERVQSLNGSLTVDSTESGATVSISIPLGWGSA
ncbi:MAG: hypothetical protein JJE51_04000 [Thermoanaerobaculia bacterium]|nr:hypothetical protein [Thermoanaerobaculia bacterium]